MTYSEVWDDETLTIEAKAIYGFLCTYAGSGNECYPGVDLMCNKLKISRARFYKHLNLLVDAGYIEKRYAYKNGLREKCIYTLKPNTLKGNNQQFDNLTKDNNQQFDNLSFVGLELEKLTTENVDTNNNTINNNIINNITNNSNMCDTAPKRTRSQFKPPTLEEVQEYCRERNNNVDADRFIDYYESNGWNVGRNKMKDWKAAVRTWERNQYSNSTRSHLEPRERTEQSNGVCHRSASDILNEMMNNIPQQETIEVESRIIR